MALAIVLALFLSLTIGLTFNASLDSTAQAGSANGSGAAAATGATPQAVDVTLTEFAISPADITVPAGVPVTFNVTNTGAADGAPGAAALASRPPASAAPASSVTRTVAVIPARSCPAIVHSTG